MIAAIYARKSTEQTGVADEARSTTRQVEHGKAFTTSKGWTVDPAHVYVDDGISGAEFVGRPGLGRLLPALSPRPERTDPQSLALARRAAYPGRGSTARWVKRSS